MMRRLGKGAYHLLRILVLLGLALLILAGILTQTAWGKDRILREALARTEGLFRGELAVEGVSSPGLLRGFTFRGVRLLGEDGRPFLEADSLRAGIFLPGLLRRSITFTDVDLWGPVITLERLPGQAELNVVRIFARGEPTDSAEAAADSLALPPTPPGDSLPASSEPALPEPGRAIGLRDVRIHGGTVQILLPLEGSAADAERLLVERAPDGRSRLRRMTFRDLDLRVARILLAGPDLEGQRLEGVELAMTGEVWRDPFRVEQLAGSVSVLKSRLEASLSSLRLSRSQAQGSVEVQWGDEARGVRVGVRGEAAPLALEDLRFIEGRLPSGLARGPFGLVLDDDGVLLDFPGTELALGAGQVEARGGLFLGRELGLRNLALELDRVEVGVTDSWLVEPLPFRGTLTGSLGLAGGLDTLQIDADLFYEDTLEGGSTHAQVVGAFLLGESFGVRDLQATFAPLEWRTLGILSPAMRLRGPGSLRLEADGRLRDGLRLSAEATHVPPGGPPSRVTAAGVLRVAGDDPQLDFSGELRPLSLTSLRADYPELPATGEVSGPVTVRGSLADLTVTTELATAAGPLNLTARLDAHRPGDHYALEVEAGGLLLSDLVPSLPSPTRVSGRVLAQGRGLSLDSLAGEADVFLQRGEVGGLVLDSATLVVRVAEGRLFVDALRAHTELGRLNAGGTFALSGEAAPGEVNLQLESPSLTALRPFLMEEPTAIYENLSDFERKILLEEGVNLDTLPRAAEVAVDGKLQARATFRGGIREFSGEGTLAFDSLRYRADFVETGTASFSARGLPGEGRRVQALIRADSILVAGMGFQGGEFELEVGRREGRVRAFVVRGPGEDYRARGTFSTDTLGGGMVYLDDLTVRFDSVRWNLGGPASLAWNPQGLRVRDFRLIRPGVGFLRIQANGLIPREGEGDFELEVDRLNLARVADLLQMEEALEGVVDLTVRITGRPEDPLMEGSVRAEGLRYGQLSLDSVASRLEYRNRSVGGEVAASLQGREVLSASGTFPADLRLKGAEGRIPEEPVDLTVAVDSFPASLALAFLETIEDVSGTLTGEVRLGGTPNALAPEGELRLADGAATLPDLGVRYGDVRATFGLRPDGTVQVEGSARSRGTATVTGSVTLDPVTDPPLDLRVRARDFLAVDRRDVRSSLSGEMTVQKSYRRPRVEGSLTVEQGVLMVEELVRSAEVVDLSDPAFFNVVDTSLVSLRPVLRTLQASQNPFLQNLQLNLQVSVAQDSWLRGRDLNVEMAGNLSVFWDRTQRDLALVGDLRAVRGVYSVLGRQFQVQEGTVSFQGTPGVNPDLDIQAINRLRTPEGDRLDIIATVEGTLLTPRVSLSSNAPYAIGQSDLVSYLIFGRPTYALTSVQSQYAKGAAGSLLGVATGATANLAMGLFSSELGSVVTRDVGLDFLAISREQDAASLGTQDLTGTMAATQVEIGQYLTQDIFAALLWRPLTGLAGTSRNQFGGLRVEWRLNDLWTLEGFVEDRLLRSSLFRSVDANLQGQKVLGFFLFREWGY